MENTCTFTRDSLTIDSNTFPAEYSVTPAGTVFIFVNLDVDGEERKLRIKITADDPRYAAALAAAQEPEPQPEQADVQPEQPQEEQPARDPKQARGPVPDKLFVGMEIKGKGWKIVFDGSYDRTRVIFKGSFLCPRAPVPQFVIIGDCVKRVLKFSLPLYSPDF